MKVTKYKIISGLLVIAAWYVSMKNEEEDIRDAVSDELDSRGLKAPRETKS